MSKTFLAIRPYRASIRERVLKLLLSVDLEPLKAVEVGTPDADALVRVRQERPQVLVVPFNVHRATSGETLDGLTFLQHAMANWSELRLLPIVMPVSATASAAFDLRFPEIQALDLRVFRLDEAVIGESATAARLRMFLAP